MFVKNNIRFERLNKNTMNYESLSIVIKDKEGNKCIHAIYRPRRLNISEFIGELDRNLKK